MTEKGIIFDSESKEFEKWDCGCKPIYSLHLFRYCPCDDERTLETSSTPDCGFEELKVVYLEPGQKYLNEIMIKEVL